MCYSVYQEEAGVTSVCVHQMKKLLDGDITPSSSLYIKRRSSMVCEPDLQLLVLGQSNMESFVSVYNVRLRHVIACERTQC